MVDIGKQKKGGWFGAHSAGWTLWMEGWGWVGAVCGGVELDRYGRCPSSEVLKCSRTAMATWDGSGGEELIRTEKSSKSLLCCPEETHASLPSLLLGSYPLSK